MDTEAVLTLIYVLAAVVVGAAAAVLILLPGDGASAHTVGKLIVMSGGDISSPSEACYVAMHEYGHVLYNSGEIGGVDEEEYVEGYADARYFELAGRPYMGCVGCVAP